MAKKSITIDCPQCMNTCTVHGQNAELSQFCPFCGEVFVAAYDDDDDDESYGADFDDDDYRSLADDDEE